MPPRTDTRTDKRSKRVEETHLWGELLAVHKFVSRELAADLERAAGISLVWYDTLLVLSESESGQMRLQDLEQRVLASQSGMTRLIDRMARSGHVTREKADDDGRGVYACITAEGRHAFRRAAPTFVNGVHEYFLSHLTEAEMATMRSALTNVRKVLVKNDPYWEQLDQKSQTGQL